MVESATSKEGLIKARTANIVSMLRQMINDGWVRNRQQLVIWIAKHKREGVYAAKELDNETGKLNETLDEISAEATFKEKLEALLETNSLTYLVLHPKLGVTMDSSVIDEMKNRYRISRVTHQGLADLLGFEYGPARFGNEVKKVVYAPLERFADRIAPSRGEEMAEE